MNTERAQTNSTTPTPTQYIRVVFPPTPMLWFQFPNESSQPGIQIGIPLTAANLNSENGNISDVLHQLFMQNQQESHGPPPTSKSFLDELPVKVWTDDGLRSDEGCNSECSICLTEFSKDDQVIVLPCKHVFHKECGMHWLVEHNVCPVCRHELPTETEKNSNNNNGPSPVSSGEMPNSQNAVGSNEPQVGEARTASQRHDEHVPFTIRFVRRRTEPNDSGSASSSSSTTTTATTTTEQTADTSSPSTLRDADDLDQLMDREAENLVHEELQQHSTDSCSRSDIEISDDDIDELISETQQ